MNDTNLLYLVYGMCIMFHLMMGWVFCCRKQGLAKKLIGLLMLLVAVQYAKDLVFLPGFYAADPVMEHFEHRHRHRTALCTHSNRVLPSWLALQNACLLA